jgi:maleate cis-trans isomerase
MHLPPLRVGLLVPENNTTMHAELPAWLPDASTCRRVGISRAPGLLTLPDLDPYVDQAMRLAEAFHGAVDVTVYGCTAAGILAGPARDAAIASRLEAVSAVPAVTTAGAMIAWLRAHGARRIALVTPYSDSVNDDLVRFLGDASIDVHCLSSFKAAGVAELGRITAAQVEARAIELMERQGEGCDALFIGCSQLPTQSILAGLRSRFGIPVSSSIHATAWQVVQRMHARADVAA